MNAGRPGKAHCLVSTLGLAAVMEYIHSYTEMWVLHRSVLYSF